MRVKKNIKRALKKLIGKKEKSNLEKHNELMIKLGGYINNDIENLRNKYQMSDINDKKFHQDVLNNPSKYIVGHLEEIISMGYNLPSYLKYAPLALYKNHFNLDILVETGTLQGRCSLFFKEFFKEIYTIDIDEYCYNNAKKIFKDYKNINPILGDSAQELPKLLKKIDKQALFFLDGHYTYMPHNEYKSLKSDIGETPIVQELEAIAKHKIKDHCIVVDDAGCFCNHNHTDYPNIDEMEEISKKLFPNHSFEIKYGSIYIMPELVPTV